jgi:NADPH-dependent glutamate synthase beta subunit-like oxidoreductase
MSETDTAPDIFATAARCANCAHPACMEGCPDQIDLRALFEFVATHAPMPITWKLNEQEAESFVREAIETSFTLPTP